jgi:CRISPR system Cascade subunit CasD
VVEVLTFALVAPMASFGDVTVGERRSGWDRPGRSAVLGLIGACLGLERADAAAQGALAEGYGVALLCRAPGRLLADYHTAQVPPTKRGRRFATRAEELDAPDLGTVLTRRDYRVGAWHLGAVTARDGARWTLVELAAAMERPVFTPYLGRKSCPLGLPLAPAVTEATDVLAALERRHAEGREASFAKRLKVEDATVRIVLDADAFAENHPRHRRTEWRRDAPLSRERWQFGLRSEAVIE